MSKIFEIPLTTTRGVKTKIVFQNENEKLRISIRFENEVFISDTLPEDISDSVLKISDGLLALPESKFDRLMKKFIAAKNGGYDLFLKEDLHEEKVAYEIAKDKITIRGPKTRTFFITEKTVFDTQFGNLRLFDESNHLKDILFFKKIEDFKL